MSSYKIILSSDSKVIDYVADCKLIESKVKRENIILIKMFKILAGVDNIEDERLQLKYEQQSLSRFGILKKQKYLTVQCGQGVSGDFGSRGWSLENWEKFVAIVREKLDKDIKIIQIIQVGMTKASLKVVDININRLTTLEEL